jgi:hypothetical protein
MILKFIFIKIVFLILLITISTETKAQLDSLHSPKKAACRSAILPGWGQAYNQKKWKIPIVYAALGTSTFFIIANNKQYSFFRKSYLQARNTSAPVLIEGQLLTDADLLLYKNYYRRNLDLSVIITALAYSLNIVDALVDAHLKSFDVSDDLKIGLMLMPDINQRSMPALSFQFSF